MAIQNANYFIQQPLQQCIFDKDGTGPLSAGVVSYYSDPAFTIPKDVYQVTSTLSGYTYVNLGSELTLSSIGSFVDGSGNNLQVMLFPWTGTESDPGTFEPYYITVYSSGSILQFTVEGFPLNSFNESGDINDEVENINQITNPQFSTVLFQPTGITLSLTGSNVITAVAPGWFIKTSGTGTVTLIQQSLVVDTPSGAPYSLDIQSSAGITSIILYQRIYNSPRLLNGTNIAVYFEAACPSAIAVPLTLGYQYSTDVSITNIDLTPSVTPIDLSYTSVVGSTNVSGSPSTANGTGYLDIILTLETNTRIQVTSFQLVSVSNLSNEPLFYQISTPLQQAQLFWYYNSLLQYKPIPSYLVGWDFPFNPVQLLGPTGNAASLGGANLSQYIWDQTILFASVDNVLNFTRNSSTFGIKIGTSGTSSFALVQYLQLRQAREILSQRNALQLKGLVSSGTLTGTVSLFWTSGSLPSLAAATYQSLVSSVSASGVPTAGNGTWTAVPNVQYGNSVPFSLSTTDSIFNFNQFDATASSAGTTATFIAIVIAFAPMTSAQSITIDYCSLVGGDIPTRPAPKTPDEVLRECQFYFESTYNMGGAPGTPSTIGQILAPQVTSQATGGGTLSAFASPFELQFNTIKASSGPIITFYSPSTGASNNVLYNAINNNASVFSSDVMVTSFWTVSTGQRGANYVSSTATAVYTAAAVATAFNAYIQYQCTIDARLGLV